MVVVPRIASDRYVREHAEQVKHAATFTQIDPDTRERIIERLQPWKEAGKRGEVGSMLVGAADPKVLELLAEEML